MRPEFTKKKGFGGSERLSDEKYHEISKNRLINRIKKENECWIWCGYISNHGYGVSSYRSKSILVHRLSWILFKGLMSSDLDVCHHCDNPKCINPDHLFLGTAKDNIIDCFNKKRKSHKGEKHPNSKISENDVIKIFELRKIGWTHQKLADMFKITQGTISNILHRRLWKHVELGELWH